MTSWSCDCIGVSAGTCTHCIDIEVVKAMAAYRHAAATACRGVLLPVQEVHLGSHCLEALPHGLAAGGLLRSAPRRCGRKDGACGHGEHCATGSHWRADRLHLAGVSRIATQVQGRIALVAICTARAQSRSKLTSARQLQCQSVCKPVGCPPVGTNCHVSMHARSHWTLMIAMLPAL